MIRCALRALCVLIGSHAAAHVPSLAAQSERRSIALRAPIAFAVLANASPPRASMAAVDPFSSASACQVSAGVRR
jgi:hypothetical protein